MGLSGIYPLSFQNLVLRCAAAAALAIPVPAVPAAETSRIWTSRDGRALQARGLHVSATAVSVLRQGDANPVEIPLSNLIPADTRWAVDNLPVWINDDVRVTARTVSQNRNVYQRETGRYAVSVTGTIRYGTFDGFGTIRPITERVVESGRVVDISFSSLSGEGITAIEFYTIQGSGRDRRIHSVQTGIYEFDRVGSSIRIPTDTIENFSGWAVVTRSVNTGRIIEVVGSLHPIAELVKEKAPERVTFSVDQEALRRIMRSKLGLE